mgnify:CR=1 FL=1
MTPPAVSVTSLELMPVFGQSENRPLASDLSSALASTTAGQVYYLSGMATVQGAEVGPSGARTVAIDQTIPATGFMSADTLGDVSPAFTFQQARAARWRDAGQVERGAVIADHGSGGRFINEWMESDPSPLGRNQNYWIRQSAARAGDQTVTVASPYFFVFQGQSGGLWTYAEYETAFNSAADYMLDEIASSVGGTQPVPVTVVIGGTVNTTERPYENAKFQYDMTLARGGILATWQRAFLIGDNYIHPRAREQVLYGETCEWAVSEVEAGNAWNITYSVSKTDATVVVTFNLRPGETLMDRAGMYDLYGGSSTCPNYGFEADGGIVSAVPNLSGNTVTLTLSRPDAAWMRFAMQRQNVFNRYNEIVDTDGVTRRLNYSAHRTTLFGSHTRASRFVPGETLWRPLPSFAVPFGGGA